MSLNGLVHPKQEKCQSLNWSWVRANQLAPQGLGPIMNTEMQCNYGDYAPYTSQKTIRQLEQAQPFRVWGYPNVTSCSRLGPLLYAPRVDKNPRYKTVNCTCSSGNPGWPQGFYCGHSLPLNEANL